MLRQLYPIMLSITVALAIGVYMHPGEARKWIQQAGQWGSQVASDALRATVVLADETRSNLSPPGYASTNPSGGSTNGANSPTPYDPAWTYVADSGLGATTLGTPVSPPASHSGYSQPNSTSPAWPVTTGPLNSNERVYPRVLASNPSTQDPRDPGQPVSPYPATNPSQGANGSWPSAGSMENPLRPSMPREAPWAATAGGFGSVSELPPTTAYQEAQVQPRLGAAYPKVQWAGDWQDYRGVPETVKPTDQFSSGYLPPPDIESTTTTVDRYLPNQIQNSAQSLPDAAARYQGAQPLPTMQSPAVSPAPYQQVPYGATAGSMTPNHLLPQSLPPSVPGPQLAPFQGTATQPQPAPDPRVASLSPRSAIPAISQPQPADPPGAQLESPDPVADLTICEGAQILYRVGSEVGLASEILPIANEMLSGVEGIDKASEDDLAKAREQLVKRILPQHIELKLLYVDAKRNLPAEAIENINKQLSTRFEEVEVPERLKKLKLNSRRELETQLAAWGSSLEHEKQAFIEKAIAQQWVFEKVRKEEDISHEELLDYYQAHAAEYDHPTRVRWEHLEVTFRLHPDKREAWQLIATMGNAVQQGQPFAQVAKERSEGVLASNGGQRDWLTQGSLKSDILDRALFSLPVGAMSPILEDETGFHIVRVVECENGYRTPFEEIQSEIREKLKGEHKQARLTEFVARLREEIPVWTVFDQQTADASVSAASSDMRF